ncbi:MAG: hypothetical protein K2X39_04610, partial [Silvanigrellaceae bacterium]|nr:hypothetical protein [Silvanigrellaceae bacterium]
LKASPSAKLLTLSPLFEGPFSLTLKFKKHFNIKPKVEILPSDVQFSEGYENQFYFMHFQGKFSKDSNIVINLFQEKIAKIDHSHELTIVGCPSIARFASHNYLVKSLNEDLCWYLPVAKKIVEENYLSLGKKPLLMQKTLSNEEVHEVTGSGGGEALKNALKEWGYAK